MSMKLAHVATQHLAKIRKDRADVMLFLIQAGTLEGVLDLGAS